MSAPSNTIAIVGATGIQGRSVASAFLSLPDWHVRGLTRNPDSPSAKALAAQGAELVQTNLECPESLSAIVVNTDFWAPYGVAKATGETPERATQIGFETELLHAKNAAEAASTISTLRRFVYSALGPMKAASGGKYPHSGHWDSKAAAADYIEKKIPELVGKVSFVYPGAYHTNSFLYPQRLPHLGDEWVVMMPGPITTTIPVIDTDVTFGLLTRALIIDEDAGVKLLACDCHLTTEQAIEAWNKFTGKSARFEEVTLQQMQEITRLPLEVLEAPAFLAEYNFMDGVEGRVITPADLKSKVETKTFEQILEQRGLDEVLETKPPAL
jgi:hypothetical protein